MTLIPAYGRDYRNAVDAKRDWTNGKDFIIARTGQYCSIRDNIPDVFIRFNKMRSIIKP